MKKVLFVFIALVFCCTCKKESTYCWQIYDAHGQALNQVCGKTEAQIHSEYPNVLVDKANAPKYCWQITPSNGGIFYTTAISENFVNYFYTKNSDAVLKVDCATCQSWRIREKDSVKTTGSYWYGPEQITYLCGDTTKTLYEGRLIVTKESVDTTYYIEFVIKN